MKQLELADLFDRVADFLELKSGENPFRIRAYRKAALNLRNLIGDLEEKVRSGSLRKIPGVGPDLAKKIESFKVMINRVKKAYPTASVFATTLREVLSANRHLWGAIMAEGADWHVVEPREITVLDRIGGGDGFVGGMLHAILRGWEPEQWVQFGWASGALATTHLTDYAQPADEEQIWSIWKGNARVQR